MPGNTLAACGPAGSVCTACNVGGASACVSGQCRCGLNPQCGPGQTCDAQSGSCGCGPASCPNGCCQLGICYTEFSAQQCPVSQPAGQECSVCGGIWYVGPIYGGACCQDFSKGSDYYCSMDLCIY